LPVAAPLDFHVLISAISLGSFHPVSVLFESSTIDAANYLPTSDSGDYNAVTVDLSGLTLTPGQEYA
jgi:hypothetical protein